MRKTLLSLLVTAAIAILSPPLIAAQTVRTSVSAVEVNGTFRMNFSGKYKEFANELKILALGGGKLRIAFDLVFPYSLPNNEITVNLGTLDDEAAIAGDTAIYTSEDSECTITLRFVRPGSLEVKQSGSDAACGFGRGVYAAGNYLKVSSKKPKFEERK